MYLAKGDPQRRLWKQSQEDRYWLGIDIVSFAGELSSEKYADERHHIITGRSGGAAGKNTAGSSSQRFQLLQADSIS